MAMLLKRYLYYRKKTFPSQAAVIEKTILIIEKERAVLQNAKNRTDLMLAEARAARAYWHGFAMLARCPSGWRRIHPRAGDPWNRALNIGYTMLANFLRPIITDFGLSLEIGIVHAPEAGDEPLLYDFEELFRQPFVDAVLISLLARTEADKCEQKIIVNKLGEYFRNSVRYAGQNMKLRTVVQNELYAFRRALSEGAAYLPYRHSWAHWAK